MRCSVIVVVSFRRREQPTVQPVLLLGEQLKQQPLIKWNPAHAASLLSDCRAWSKMVTTHRVL